MSTPSSSPSRRRAVAGAGGSAARLSPFYRDLASPLPHHRTVSRLATSSFVLTSPASAPQPPPLFTLNDRSYSAEHTSGDGDVLLPASPVSTSPSPFSSPSSSMRVRSFGRGSPVEGVVLEKSPEVLVASSPSAPPDEFMVPPIRTVEPVLAVVPVNVSKARMEKAVDPDHEEWVTVFGFYLGDTNIVLREFEKFGAIIKHISGPKGANWMHLLYQHAYDARKALEKNGTQLSSGLLIGVKTVDHAQRQLLDEQLNRTINRGFMVSLPSRSHSANTSANTSQFESHSRPYSSKANTSTARDGGHRQIGSIASPTGSIFSKALDMVFGI